MNQTYRSQRSTAGGGEQSEQVSESFGQPLGNAAMQEQLGLAREAAGERLGDQQLYAHGGYMAAVDDVMCDALWSSILSMVTPEDMQGLMDEDSTEERMGIAENNPVVAAYGHVRSGGLSGSGDTLPIEWDVWLDRDSPQDLDSVVVEHGDPFETVTSRVTTWSTPKGASATQWIQSFNDAIRMFQEGRATTTNGLFDDQDFADVLRGGGGGGLVLDVKSSWSTAEDVAAFVAALTARQIEVVSVGSFKAAQLLGVDPEKRLRFFFDVPDLLQHEATLSEGERVMINLGSLLDSETHVPDSGQIRDLRRIQQAWSLQLGGYTQESNLSPDAHDALVRMVVSEPALFTLGYAYGNVDGQANESAVGTGWRGADKAGGYLSRDDSLEEAYQIDNHATRLGLAVEILMKKGMFGLADMRMVGGGFGAPTGLMLDPTFSRIVSLANELDLFDEKEPQKQELYRTVNRAEAATMVCRAFNLPLWRSGTGASSPFPDVEPGDWFAPYVLGAHDVGVIEGIDGEFRPGELMRHEHLTAFVSKAASWG
ncbi:MAG: S-layer homology domain-containing protein [Alphaproteobacteria bacterium]|nr:S-layer homology domain-containing protein [Alphaproteobacteria bacterium]